MHTQVGAQGLIVLLRAPWARHHLQALGTRPAYYYQAQTRALRAAAALAARLDGSCYLARSCRILASFAARSALLGLPRSLCLPAPDPSLSSILSSAHNTASAPSAHLRTSQGPQASPSHGTQVQPAAAECNSVQTLLNTTIYGRSQGAVAHQRPHYLFMLSPGVMNDISAKMQEHSLTCHALLVCCSGCRW